MLLMTPKIHQPDILWQKYYRFLASGMDKELNSDKIPYSGLFSLNSNFPESHKLTQNSGKFILGNCIRFGGGSLL